MACYTAFGPHISSPQLFCSTFSLTIAICGTIQRHYPNTNRGPEPRHICGYWTRKPPGAGNASNFEVALVLTLQPASNLGRRERREILQRQYRKAALPFRQQQNPKTERVFLGFITPSRYGTRCPVIIGTLPVTQQGEKTRLLSTA